MQHKYLLGSLLIAISSLAFANNSQHIAESGVDNLSTVNIAEVIPPKNKPI